ncbi:hypothetical protein CYMTET_36322 [Cymbomonas tetramitiformis]|uniref:Uncharacterized protein n=1 Tax=Cymbomonas tetramitiformis TaxID=36881 RepID=A0AAE0CHF9_9CHLO|nr:hypothetical protein CYMTET_36322 [Cymbomonas tetramitiformis]
MEAQHESDSKVIGELQENLYAEQSSRAQERSQLAQDAESLRDRLAELEGENASATRERFGALEEERAAILAKDLAVQDKERVEQEIRSMCERLLKAEADSERLQIENDGLRNDLEKASKQRDNHCAHAELLLKEKNRLGVQLAGFKKETHEEDGTDEYAFSQRLKSAKGGKATVLQDNRTMKGPVIAAKQQPTQQAFHRLEIERDSLMERVKGLEKEKEALTTRFRAATDARRRLEKIAQKNYYRPSSASSSPVSATSSPGSVLR